MTVILHLPPQLICLLFVVERSLSVSIVSVFLMTVLFFSELSYYFKTVRDDRFTVTSLFWECRIVADLLIHLLSPFPIAVTNAGNGRSLVRQFDTRR